jgi:hypothetical protein
VWQGNLGRHVFSCGCQKHDALIARNTTHGLRRHPLYAVWFQMQQRCYNTAHKYYTDYGGRGIVVCDRWRGRNGFKIFLQDMGTRPTPLHSLDRKDNGGPYAPKNCRWATKQQQARNSRRVRPVTCRDETHCIAEWAEITGIKAQNIRQRLNAGWSPERALEMAAA